MLNCKNLMLGVALCMGFAAPAMAEDVTSDTVVATVGDTKITVGHMVAMTLTLPEDQRQLPLPVIFEGILERLIQQEAVSQSQPELTRRTQLQLDNERRSLVAGEIVNGLAKEISVTPEALQAAYDKRYADFEPSPEYNASHILVPTEEEAQEIIAALEGGADFAELAKEKSTGPSGPGGGELGWFGLGRMVPPFEAAVIELEKGAVSPPTKTDFGWHVIKLNDMRKPGVPPLDDIKAELEQEVWLEMLEAKIKTLVDQVTINRPDISGISPEVLADPAMLAD